MADHKHIFDEHGSIIKLKDPLVYHSELDKELANMEDRVSQNIDKKFAELNQKLDQKFNQIDDKFKQIDDKFKQIDDKFDQMNKNIDHKFDRILQVIGIGFGFLAAMIAIQGIIVALIH